MDGVFCVYCILISCLSEEKIDCKAAGCNVHRTAQNHAKDHNDTRKLLNILYLSTVQDT